MSEQYTDAQFESRPDGAIIIDSMEVAHTVMCCHCGNHFISQRGSGKIRGFCVRCNARTCGEKKCDLCVPFEARLEYLEGKKNSLYKDKIISLVDKYGNIL